MARSAGGDAPGFPPLPAGPARDAYEDGQRLMRAGDGAAALAAYDRAVELEPGSVQAHWMRANTAGAMGRLGEAADGARRCAQVVRDLGHPVLAGHLDAFAAQADREAARSRRMRARTAERRRTSARPGPAVRVDPIGVHADSAPVTADPGALTGIGVDVTRLEPVRDTERGSILGLTVRSPDPLATWRVFRASVDATGYWPVLFDADATPATVAAFLDGRYAADPRTLDEIIATAAARPFDTTRAIEEIERAIDEDQDLESQLIPADGDRPEGIDLPPPGPRPAGAAGAAEVTLVAVPTTTAAHVPALLRFGDEHSAGPCPEHVAALTHWHARHGAGVLAVAARGDRLDLHVPRPPTSWPDAVARAQEQWVYCPDSVDTVPTHAAGLVGSEIWSFWWD